MLDSRSASIGFAERTRKNLNYIREAFSAGADVHVVTQAVNSLLGLVVFPWEKGIVERFRNIGLEHLNEDGWPQWVITKGRCTTLGELTRYIRNGASHGHLQFSSDSRTLEDVTIQVSNYPPKSKDPNFVASIRAQELVLFCEKFSVLVHGLVS